MSKNYLILYCLAVLCYIARSQETPPRLPFEKSQYTRSISVYSKSNTLQQVRQRYEIINGHITDRQVVDQVTQYNRNGTVHEIRYLKDGKRLQQITVFEYQGIIPQKSTTYFPDGEIVAKELYEYTTDELLHKYSSWLLFEEIQTSRFYEMDKAKNQLFVELHKNGEHGSSFVHQYTHPDTGRILKTEKYKSSGELLYSIHFRYENDLLIEENYFTDKNEIAYTIFFEYDRNGNLIEKRKQSPLKKQIYRYVYRYNNNNQLTGHIKHGRRNETLEYYKYSYEYIP